MPGGGKGGGSSSTVTVNNGPVTVDADSTVEVKGLDNIKLTLEPTPLKSESKQELILPQPFKTESKIDTTSGITSDSKNAMSIDLKPVALDVCLKSSSELPQGQICQPFSFHLGVTWFGMETFGLNFGGESRIVMQDLPKKPAIDWPAQQNAAAPHDHHHHSHHDGSAKPTPSGGGASGGQNRGLRVRIK
jgi:hypothetical protein